ncbi:glycosyltransferase family 2 protein [Roseateles puraquae]|uniref:glycosyltransferase family 2 protein n=1 Tax=Roseateles puraquae TaxID=431059 RepID=UPI0031D637D6
MSRPLVSIVTPVYNQAEFLAATLDSVLAQDYEHLEYIVIDDGSSDDSLAIARRYEAAHPGRLQVLTQPNSGQAATLNRGWAMARGDILAYLSSDDCLLPEAVSRMVDALQEHARAVVAYCDFWLIDAQGRRLRASRTEEFNAERLSVDLICQPGPGAFFRRGVFERQGGWRPDLRQVPDYEFWLRAATEGQFVRVPQLLAEYRIHEASASFRVMPQSRAEEIVQVMRAYWAERSDQARAQRSLARAYSLAAKNHGQSGRLGASLHCLGQALRIRPVLALDMAVWRQLFVGLLRRGWYQLRASTRTV